MALNVWSEVGLTHLIAYCQAGTIRPVSTGKVMYQSRVWSSCVRVGWKGQGLATHSPVLAIATAVRGGGKDTRVCGRELDVKVRRGCVSAAKQGSIHVP